MRSLDIIESPEDWDASLLALPDPHVLQSSTWGALKSKQGWHPTRLLWSEAGRPLAAAQILIQQRGRLRLGYIAKGPLVDWANLPLVDEVLSRLEIYARDHGLLLLKIDPDVRRDTMPGLAGVSLLRWHGWRESREQIQFCNTMVLDLRPSLDTLMEQMKSKWRYNIRLAVRRGVTVREAQESELPALYDMYAKTADRGNFTVREKPYYMVAWRQFMQANLAVPLVAEIEGEPLAMVVLLHFGERAWYMYGASRARHRQLMPNHLLQWEAIRRAKALGCTTYDLWGAPDMLDERDPLWGVYRFKQGFGAAFVPHIGAYDYTPKLWLYRIYHFLRPRAVMLAHRRYWAEVEAAGEHDAL